MFINHMKEMYAYFVVLVVVFFIQERAYTYFYFKLPVWH